jgi:hypothetical protein
MSTFRSALEESIIPAKYARFYECESFEYSIPRVYTPDLTIPHKDGETFTVIEIKGYLRTDEARAYVEFYTTYRPVIKEFVLIVERNHKVQGRKNLTVREWCQKHGFRFFESRVKLPGVRNTVKNPEIKQYFESLSEDIFNG